MSIAALNWVFRMHPRRIAGIPRSVLTVLADHADEHDSCWPSLERLEQRTSWSERAIRKALRVLEQLGLVSSCPRYKAATRYTLNLAVDLSQPPGNGISGAPRAPQKRVKRGTSDTSPEAQQQTETVAETSVWGARGAPLEKAPFSGAPRVFLGGTTGHSAGHVVPPNHHITTKEPLEGGTRTRATPLPRSWQPSEEDAAYARRLGLDPAVLAPRFRKNFFHSGKTSADWSVRWEIWCDDDAAKVPPAANATASPLPRPLPPASAAILVDPDGLDAAARSWVVNWEAKRAAGEELSGFEGAMRSYAPAAFAVVQQRKLASVARPKPRLAFSNPA